MGEPQLLVFTDLDGTLLNHHDYSYEAARPALDELAARGIPLMIATSKTRAEVEALRSELSNQHPYLVENGGAVYVPAGYFSYDDAPGEETVLGVPYRQVRRVLDDLRSRYPWGEHLKGFGDLSAEQVAQLTGLSIDDAARAKQRASSEPLQIDQVDGADPAWLTELQRGIELQGLVSKRGGRFLHVQGAVDKATGVRFLVDCFVRQFPGRRFVTAALGDSQNDLAMLRAVDHPIVLPRANRGTPRLDVGREDAILPSLSGAQGFREGVEVLLSRVPSARYPLS